LDNKNEPDDNELESHLSYKDAGVDIDAGNELVQRIKPAVQTTIRPEVMTGLGGFGAIFELDLAKWRQPLLVSGTDGVGTKLRLAQMLNCHDTIGVDLVAMCVNDILTSGAEPLFFLDYYATGKLDVDLAQSVITGIAEGCRQAGCALIGGETAEMPGMYGSGDYDLAGFAVGIVERKELLDGQRIVAGHRLLGLASSGPHSNGFSLIRKIIEISGTDLDQPLNQAAGVSASLGEALMAPTRIYVKPVLEMLASGLVDGLAHITGGGLTENIVRVLPKGLGVEIRSDSWVMPPVVRWLQKTGGVAEIEMHRTFNCGIGMVLLVAQSACSDLIKVSESHGIDCIDIGRVTRDTGGPAVKFVP
jgi:phosphoribosylformylglycinamidine cyclo-ligase